MEKPNITHKIVRRMSFMVIFLVKKKKASAKAAVKTTAWHGVIWMVQGRGRRHTKDDSVPVAPVSTKCHRLRRVALGLVMNRQNKSAQNGKKNPATD
jgi:hypothetical protein